MLARLFVPGVPLLAAIVIVVALVAAPSSALAACASDGAPAGGAVEQPAPEAAPEADVVERSAGAGSVSTRAAGDDPVVTPPADPTCDDAGYELEFPAVDTVSDVATAPQTPLVRGGGHLPVTGTSLLATGLTVWGGLTLMVAGAALVLATPRRPGSRD